MPDTSSASVVRLSSPGEIVATVPVLCGFLPSDSVVVVSLRGARRRVGLTARLDLPPVALEHRVARALAERVAADGAGAAVVVVFAPARRRTLVDAVIAACRRHGVEVIEALHVTEAAWTSYLCERACCPPEGTPVSSPPSLVEAERALEGRVVLPSREALVASLAAPAADAVAGADRLLAQAVRDWDAADEETRRAVALDAAAVALADVREGGVVSPSVAAQLAVALHDVAVRDEVATWVLEDGGALLSLVTQVCRLVVPPHDAPVCALLAWVAYARGDGGTANVALDRALATDPHHSLAHLLRQALDSAVPPSEIRGVLERTRSAVSSSGPGC